MHACAFSPITRWLGCECVCVWVRCAGAPASQACCYKGLTPAEEAAIHRKPASEYPACVYTQRQLRHLEATARTCLSALGYFPPRACSGRQEAPLLDTGYPEVYWSNVVSSGR